MTQLSKSITTALLLTVCIYSADGQSSPTRKDIPSIAKAANSAIVTIVMANGDKPISLGTGFLVSPDGVIVTNYHVVKTGNVAAAKFSDGTILPVDGVLVIDKFRDLAIIKIHGKPFTTLTLGNSDQIQVGEEVVAIGNPLGLELTVSNGILSGIRSDEKEDGKLLQITAPISRGSSGGPLFNMFGEVVGINVMFLEGGESLNFAIPVNDAKKLLENASAQLHHLPNEPDRNTPEPDSTRPDAASPREKESVIAAPAHKTAKSNQPHSYYVRTYQHDNYIIEHDGRQLAATCRETLSWPDGIDKQGRPTGPEHNCTHMHISVGKEISPELMWRQDNELRYQGPSLGVQRAEILDIIAEAPIGFPLRIPSPKTSPEILKTLHWIQNTLADGDGSTNFGKYSIKERLEDVNGCLVIKVQAKDTSDPTREQFDLGALDPTSLEVSDGLHDAFGEPLSHIWVHTTDDVQAIFLKVNYRNWQPAIVTVPERDLEWDLRAYYAARFAKALRHAITLCGGKPSAF